MILDIHNQRAEGADVPAYASGEPSRVEHAAIVRKTGLVGWCSSRAQAYLGVKHP